MSIFRTLSVTVVGAALAGAGVASAEIDGVSHDGAIEARPRPPQPRRRLLLRLLAPSSLLLRCQEWVRRR